MLSLLLDETPNTTGYMIAGYTVLIGVPILYMLSWWVRRRSLKKDIEMIKSLEEGKKE